jgi:2-succinyl-5-enolpyruvyl-6-hydroxy-3-cyclohexene-1-carboxylate synthase
MAADPVYDVVAAFAAGLVDHGVTDVVISPGSRSTPLSVTLHAQPGLTTWIQLDERSAGFFALGQARATGRPSVLVCTSGTAAANYLPAVVEAHHAGVPLIVCTADRPPELRDWGAGQTIDQVGIFSSNTRWAVDLPVADDWTPEQSRIAAYRAVDVATSSDAGPVHLNWPLREPLEPVGAVPVVQAEGRAAPSVPDTPARPSPLPAGRLPERGVIVLGPDAANGLAAQRRVAEAARSCAEATGWPLMGEPITGARSFGADAPGLMASTVDHLLKVPAVAEELVPDIVIRVGGSPTTKPVRLWLERHRPETVVLLDPASRWHDASFTVTHRRHGDAAETLRAIAESAGEHRSGSSESSSWLERWSDLERATRAVLSAELDAGPMLSARVSRSIAEAVEPGTLVMTSNSMPVRDLDAFVAAAPGVHFLGNRGASGIDGITSTALGLASRHDGPVVLYTGDIALLHDLGALFSALRAGLHLTVVCVDNDGGGIFSMLPVAQRGDEVDFETLFRTPHGLDFNGFSGIGGVVVSPIVSDEELRRALARSTASVEPGIDVLLVPVDRDADVAQRRAIGSAVAAAVGG